MCRPVSADARQPAARWQSKADLSDALKTLRVGASAAISERIGLIERAVAATTKGGLPDADRREAEWAAHKLAGILGLYGLAEASGLAAEIERALHPTRVLAGPDVTEVRRSLARIRAALGSPDAEQTA